MKRRNATRSALFTSIISLLLCVSMLVGTTFAWFTDEVKSGVNNIVAGNLDIELEYTKDPTDANSWKSVEGQSDLFSDALWEPGHTEVVYLRLSNKGTLALNYQLGINIVDETPGENVASEEFYLSDHIMFGVVEGQTTKFADRAAAVTAVTEAKALKAGYTKGTGMIAGDEAYMALVVYMPETVGNEANYKTGTATPTIQLGVNVVATQKTHEDDSFGKDYDVLAQGGYVSDAAPAEGTTKTYEIMANKGDDEQGNPEEVVIGTMEISSESVENPALPVNISVVPTAQDETVVVAADQAANSFDVTVSNIKAGNTEPIKVELKVGKGLSNVKLYHKNVLIASDYDTNTGIVTFETTSFSPFTVVYNVDRSIPQASVNDLGAQDVFATLNGWGNGTDVATYKAPFVLQFTPNETLEEANVSEYKYWHADYVVKADRDVAANSLALMGYYEVFCSAANNNNWVALSADTMIPANTEIRLVDVMGGGDGTGTGGIKVTYKDICQYGNDGTGFLCSAVDLTGANAGTTLTVELRMYAHDGDPSLPSYNGGNETGEYLTIGTYTYTFGVNEVKTADELAAALAAGGEVKLGANIDMGATQITIPAGVSADLNLNNYNLTGSYEGSDHYAMFTVDNGASLTVSGNGNVTTTTKCGESNRSLVIFQNDGKLTINGGSYLVTDNTEGKTWIIATVIDNRTKSASSNALVTINGGEFSVAGNAKNLFRNYPQQGGTATLTINGGKFNDNGATTYIWNQEANNYPGYLNFMGGTYGSQVVYEDYNGQADVKIADGVVINAYSGNN